MYRGVPRPGIEISQSSQIAGGWDGHKLFLPNNSQSVQDLFAISGIPWEDDLEYIKDVSQQWVKGDHHKPIDPLVLSVGQAEAARRLYARMNLVESVQLPADSYDGIVLLGGMQSSNDVRLDFLNNTLAREDILLRGGAKIALWGGVRPTESKEQPYFARTRERLSANTHGDRWLGSVLLDSTIATEADGLRLGAHDKLGNLTLRRMYLKLGDEASQEPLISRWDFVLNSQMADVTLLNTGAVDRPMGEPRHTTQACAEQWIRTFGNELPAGSRVGFIASQPYGFRTTRVVQSAIDALGRADIQVVGAGPGAPDWFGDHIFRGEVARSIYEDYKASC